MEVCAGDGGEGLVVSAGLVRGSTGESGVGGLLGEGWQEAGGRVEPWVAARGAADGTGLQDGGA